MHFAKSPIRSYNTPGRVVLRQQRDGDADFPLDSRHKPNEHASDDFARHADKRDNSNGR